MEFAELLMFVVVSGFDEDTRKGGAVLSKSLSNSHLEDRPVGLVLSDDCFHIQTPPPLNINRALWAY